MNEQEKASNYIMYIPDLPFFEDLKIMLQKYFSSDIKG